MKINRTKFSAPVMGEATERLYERMYGERGRLFLEILEGSPDEIAVISSMLACLAERLKKMKEAD